MKKIIYFAVLFLFCFSFLTVQAEKLSVSPVENLCKRIVGKKVAKSFSFKLLTDSIDTDRFVIEHSNNGKIIIRGNNRNSLSVGLGYYLRNFCNVRVSWSASDSIPAVTSLPIPPTTIKVNAKCKNRFFLNYCTFGYTMPFWKWNDWQRLIDWMALNGINMPLAITGQESIWYRVWKSFGMSDSQVRSYFTGPAHLPWHRMSNVDYWQSPLPTSWLESQEKLQKLILQQERDFDMTPILPAFSGHVPNELSTIYPNAKIYTMSKWGGFDDKYRSHFIDPMDSLFNEIQKRFLEEQTRLYGTNHIYGIDPFNEIDSPDWSEEFLANVSNKIYNSVKIVDDKAQWLQMTWMFYYAKDKWTQPRIKSFINAIPNGKMILLDYYCDHTEIWRQTKQYYGCPYIWCYLGNFGGNSMLAGDLKDVDMKIKRALKSGGDNMSGIGSTLEGFDCNPIMYEFVYSHAWEDIDNIDEWVNVWAKCRGGNQDDAVCKAWGELSTKVYNKMVKCGQAVLMNARPRLVGVKSWNTYPDYQYSNDSLWNIWKTLVYADVKGNSYHNFDVVNVGRQVLGNLFSDFRESFTDCYNKNDIEGLKRWAEIMKASLIDVDCLLSCNANTSVNKWISDAIDCGTNDEERRYYEENARCIISVWGQKNTQLNDYANRGWGGLTKSYYFERWSRFTNAVILAAEQGKKFDEEKFHSEITQFEYDWTKLQSKNIKLTNLENPITVAKSIIPRYEQYFKK